MEADVSFTNATFTPREVEAITGVSVDTQRNWRRFGYISGKDVAGAHARFSLKELAEILALAQLVDFGMQVRDALFVAQNASLQIMRQAIAADWTARRLARRWPLPVSTETKRFVITTKSIGAVVECDHIDDRSVTDFFAGAPVVIVMDCQRLGRLIQQRASKALCEVDEI